MHEQWTSAQVRNDWERARRQALWAGVVDVFTRRPSELLPLEEVKTRLNVRGSHYRGLQSVPLDKIVGSEGRYADFDRRFLPLRKEAGDRWMSIDNALYRDVNIPPVELYKIGDIYFVKDGNHRVSVARQRGQTEIDAYVTEYIVDVPLDPSVSMRDLLLKEEYSDFLDWTQLARLRPQQRIELTELGSYLDLINHINTHRYYLSMERGQPVSAEEAVTSWYDNVYLPVVEAIHRHNILRHFPGRTEADLYLWIMRHRDAMRERVGVEPGLDEVVLDYAAQYGRRGISDVVSGAVQTLGEVAAAVQTLGESAGVLSPRGEQAPSLEMLDFVNWARLDVACPGIDIRLSNPDDYARLRKHIEDHRWYLGERKQGEVSLEDAVRDWCSNYFIPVTTAIREKQLDKDWPDSTLADLYLEAMDQWHLSKQQGEDGGPQGGVEKLATTMRRSWTSLAPIKYVKALAAPLTRVLRRVRRDKGST